MPTKCLVQQLANWNRMFPGHGSAYLVLLFSYEIPLVPASVDLTWCPLTETARDSEIYSLLSSEGRPCVVEPGEMTVL